LSGGVKNKTFILSLSLRAELIFVDIF